MLWYMVNKVKKTFENVMTIVKSSIDTNTINNINSSMDSIYNTLFGIYESDYYDLVGGTSDFVDIDIGSHKLVQLHGYVSTDVITVGITAYESPVPHDHPDFDILKKQLLQTTLHGSPPGDQDKLNSIPYIVSGRYVVFQISDYNPIGSIVHVKVYAK